MTKYLIRPTNRLADQLDDENFDPRSAQWVTLGLYDPCDPNSNKPLAARGVYNASSQRDLKYMKSVIRLFNEKCETMHCVGVFPVNVVEPVEASE